MTAESLAGNIESEQVSSVSFQRFGGLCAMLAGASGFLYAVFFVIVPRVVDNPGTANIAMYSLFLMLGGVFTTAALLALYNRLRETDTSFALWSLILGIIGAGGAIIHGGYDLANALNPPAGTNGDFPFQVDPRGLLTFGVAGIGLFTASWLMTRNPHFPKSLGYLGYLSATLLIILYLGRLIILDANNLAIVIPALLAGFIINPAFYIGLGTILRRNA